MTPTFIYKFANAIGDFCNRNRDNNASVLIARDTRASGLILENIISAILLFKGVRVILCGVLPTPALSTVLDHSEYSLGIMITASHNPHYDNGIKLFGANGFKLQEEDEIEIEKGIINPRDIIYDARYGYDGISTIDGAAIYSNFILNKFLPIEVNQPILVDCSNGACSDVVLASMIGLQNIHFSNSKPNGVNINLDCGALEPERLLDHVRTGGYAYGVAFDGDGDRSIFVSADYGVIESEKMVCLFYQILSSSQNSNVVVSTEICNLALAHNLQEIGASLIETEVGDRFVTEATKDKHAILGAEPSGHYHFPAISKSMDGFLGLMYFLRVLNVYGKNLPGELYVLKHYDRVVKNIDIKQIEAIDLAYIRQKMLNKIKPNEEKLVVRQSMWDPVLRVYYDYVHVNRFIEIEQSIHKLLSEKDFLL